MTSTGDLDPTTKDLLMRVKKLEDATKQLFAEMDAVAEAIKKIHRGVK